MEFKEFVCKTAAAVREGLGEGYRVSEQQVRRNNGVTLTGLSVFGSGADAAPVICLEPYYEDYIDGAAFGDIISGVMEKVRVGMDRGNFDISVFTDFGMAKERLSCRLINTGKNTGFLGTVPHREFLDLSIVYAVDAGWEKEGEQGSILVKNEHMEMWGVTEQELYDCAGANTAGEADVNSMAEIIGEKAAGGAGLPVPDAFPVYVITNKRRWYGAAEMTNKKAMQKTAGIFGGDFMILPSSVHEILAVPVPDGQGEAGNLAGLVREINDTLVMDDEILSYHVYRYDYGTGNIVIAA